MDAEPRDALIAELESAFPLLRELRFSWKHDAQSESLPPAIALFAAMTNPRIQGDNCILVPSRENVASLVAILVALQATLANFPKLLKRYVEDAFTVGERVRVLPTGHVYLFDGYFYQWGQRFFKLRIIEDKTNGTISFPLGEAVRLEKTSRYLPRGKGDTALGKFALSKLDFVIGTETGGNHALFANEVVLVAARNSFVELLDELRVERKQTPGHSFALSEVIPWGVVNSSGEIEFRNSAAAAGEPLIAISPRPEYVAAFVEHPTGRILQE